MPLSILQFNRKVYVRTHAYNFGILPIVIPVPYIFPFVIITIANVFRKVPSPTSLQQRVYPQGRARRAIFGTYTSKEFPAV